MQGSPLLRALILSTALAVVGLLISAIARDRNSDPPPTLTAEPSTSIPSVLGILLSAPADSLTLTSLDGNTVLLQLDQPELDSEHALSLPIKDKAFTALLSITWSSPGNNRFLQITLEPELLDSRELLLHAPDDLDQYAIEFDWTPE